MTTVATALAHARVALTPVTDTPVLEAQVLLAYVLQVSRTELIAWPEKTIPPSEATTYEGLVARRASGEPLAYVMQQKEFWSMPLTVTKATLIPRADTETLVETVLALFPEVNGKQRVADLGTGSGAIALALQAERPQWEVHATDISREALRIASNNAHQFGLERIAFHEGSWCNALPSMKFDLIVSNPPYLSLAEWPVYAAGLAHEPYQALVSGEDGLTAIRDIVTHAPLYLVPGGVLIIEHGFAQADAVAAIFIAAGYHDVRGVKDAAGQPRVTLGKLST